MSEKATVSRVIPAPAKRIFHAWLDPAEHEKMTGAGATGTAAGAFTAWDGYISGRTVSTKPYTRIEQAWRSTEFPPGAPDSRLVVTLAPAPGGTRVTLRHSNLPEGQAASYAKGWEDFYFDPMTRYFSGPGSQVKQAGEALGTAFDEVAAAVKKTRKQATREAVKAVSAVKKVERRVVARVKAAGRRVTALLKPTTKVPKPAAKKKVSPRRKNRASVASR
jgi:uncharacterized protein YndB with AHSA1/START domain